MEKSGVPQIMVEPRQESRTMAEAHTHKGHAFSRYNASHVLSVLYEAYQLSAFHRQPALMDFCAVFANHWQM